MNTIKIQQRGLITLPKKLRETLALEEGCVLNVQHIDGKIILEPQSNLDEQLALDIKKGLEDIKQGRYIEFSNIDEMHEKLETYEN